MQSVQWIVGTEVQCKCNSLCSVRVNMMEGRPLVVNEQKFIDRIVTTVTALAVQNKRAELPPDLASLPTFFLQCPHLYICIVCMYICLNCIYLYLYIYCQCLMLTVCTKGLRVTQFQFSVCVCCTCGRIDIKADFDF